MTPAAAEDGAEGGRVVRLLRRLVDVRPGEEQALLIGASYFFLVLYGWFILRPIRDETAAAGGVGALPWLFLGTLIVTIIANPLFSSLVARVPVKRFIPITYRFFAANLVLFYLALQIVPEENHVWVGRAFFIWTSMFNVFVVSVFWGFMADSFRSEQGKRLFGFIGAGGTLGAVAGSATTVALAEAIGPAGLLLVSAVLLEGAVWCVKLFPMLVGRPGASALASEPAGDAERRTAEAATAAAHPIGGSMWDGFRHVVKTPYLLMIAFFVVLFTLGSTFLYFQQSEYVGSAFTDRAERTAFLAQIELAVQLLTVVVQIFLTGRVMRRIGVGWTLAFLPLISVIGFVSLAITPVLGMFVVFQIFRRAGEFALSRPAREVLYTVVSREDKYKAKSFIDTFVYRAGDQVGAWTYAGLVAAGLTLGGIAFVAVPISLIWLGVALWLGRRHAAASASGGLVQRAA